MFVGRRPRSPLAQRLPKRWWTTRPRQLSVGCRRRPSPRFVLLLGPSLKHSSTSFRRCSDAPPVGLQHTTRQSPVNKLTFVVKLTIRLTETGYLKDLSVRRDKTYRLLATLGEQTNRYVDYLRTASFSNEANIRKCEF